MTYRYVHVDDAKRDVVNFLSRMGIATLPHIRRALPGYPTQTVEKAVRELRQENVVAVHTTGNNRVQKRPLRLEVVE